MASAATLKMGAVCMLLALTAGQLLMANASPSREDVATGAGQHRRLLKEHELFRKPGLPINLSTTQTTMAPLGDVGHKTVHALHPGAILVAVNGLISRWFPTQFYF